MNCTSCNQKLSGHDSTVVLNVNMPGIVNQCAYTVCVECGRAAVSALRNLSKSVREATETHEAKAAELAAAVKKAEQEFIAAGQIEDKDERLAKQTEMGKRVAQAGARLQLKNKQWREYLLRQQAKLKDSLGSIKPGTD